MPTLPICLGSQNFYFCSGHGSRTHYFLVRYQTWSFPKQVTWFLTLSAACLTFNLVYFLMLLSTPFKIAYPSISRALILSLNIVLRHINLETYPFHSNAHSLPINWIRTNSSAPVLHNCHQEQHALPIHHNCITRQSNDLLITTSLPE